MLGFCPDVENIDELLKLLESGAFKQSVRKYLIELMVDDGHVKLLEDVVEFFEMDANIKDLENSFALDFWDKKHSGIVYSEGYSTRYVLKGKYEQFFDLFVEMINKVYAELVSMINDPDKVANMLEIDKYEGLLSSLRNTAYSDDWTPVPKTLEEEIKIAEYEIRLKHLYKDLLKNPTQ